MQIFSLNGTRVGTLWKTLLYLAGVPVFLNNKDGGELTKGRTNGLNWDTLNPLPHPEDPVNIKCYGVLGCIRVKYGIQRGFHLFPEAMTIIKPTICLQVYQDRSCKFIEPEAETLEGMVLSSGKKSYWIAHGYIDTGHKLWTQKLADELLEYDNSCNVYIIDWARGAEPPYSQAVVNIELLGAYIGHLMTLIQDIHRLPINQTHFIGHSLGAHFGGFTGHWLKERGFHLARISGLDPAQPYFQELKPDVRLDASDAMFVDVIHTDAKPLLAGGSISGLGTQEASGHVDFYPNNGKEQPGCSDGVYQAILQENGSLLYGLRRFFACDHLRSIEIFIESIRSPCIYMSFACPNWDSFLSGTCTPMCDNDSTNENCNRMGFHARKPISFSHLKSDDQFWQSNRVNDTLSIIQPSKMYYSITGNRMPYCREHYRVTLELAGKSLFRTHSDLYLLILGQKGVLDKMKLGVRDLREAVSFQYIVPGHDFRGVMNRVILKPSTSSPIWWLVNRVVRNPDITVNSVSILNMESNLETVLCPDGTPYLRMSEEDTNVLLTSSACYSSLLNFEPVDPTPTISYDGK